MINKLKSEFNKFKNFGIDLNEANKTANKTKLTTNKAETIVKKGKQDLKDIKNKDILAQEGSSVRRENSRAREKEKAGKKNQQIHYSGCL